ncbi:uncharacterized protein G2W53_044501 [Senna tora]|uniref:Uncharacterized protein n=1 Tax=Senna tora TaxID=362788 RepID=A0A834SDX7_9FABA|nr:uncharacterized protein G2W53_044501 [Senna tora]
MCSVRSVSVHRLLPFSIALTSHPWPCPSSTHHHHRPQPPFPTAVRRRQEPPPTSI